MFLSAHKAWSIKNRRAREGTFTFYKPRNHQVGEVPVRVRGGAVVLGDRHGGKRASPYPRGGKRQLLREKAIQLPEPGSEVRPQIRLHEFGRPNIRVALEVFLRPILSVFGIFSSVPIPADGKTTRPEPDEKEKAEHPKAKFFCRGEGTHLSTVRSPRQNLCPKSTILDSREQERTIVPPYRKRSPKVRTCSDASPGSTNPCKIMEIMSPL